MKRLLCFLVALCTGCSSSPTSSKVSKASASTASSPNNLMVNKSVVKLAGSLTCERFGNKLTINNTDKPTNSTYGVSIVLATGSSSKLVIGWDKNKIQIDGLHFYKGSKEYIGNSDSEPSIKITDTDQALTGKIQVKGMKLDQSNADLDLSFSLPFPD